MEARTIDKKRIKLYHDSPVPESETEIKGFVTFTSHGRTSDVVLEEISAYLPKHGESIWAVYAEHGPEETALMGFISCGSEEGPFSTEAVTENFPDSPYEGFPLIVYCEYYTWESFPGISGDDRTEEELKNVLRQYLTAESHAFRLKRKFQHFFDMDRFGVTCNYSYNIEDAARELGKACEKKILGSRYGIAVQAVDILLIQYIVIRLIVAHYFSWVAAALAVISYAVLRIVAVIRANAVTEKLLSAEQNRGVRTANCSLEEERVVYQDNSTLRQMKTSELKEIFTTQSFYILVFGDGRYVPIDRKELEKQDHELREYRSWVAMVRKGK